MSLITAKNQPFIDYTKKGVFCVPGGFYLDPWYPVDYAIISHAHADHARWGMKHYLCHHHSKPILQYRIAADISVESLEYDEVKIVNGVKISFHSAGHLIGSAQIRLEWLGKVVVFTGDYKVHPDGISVPFEPVKCDVFITESTFGLPIYKWQSNAILRQQMADWVTHNQSQGKTSVFIGYSLGKAQRIMQLIDGVDDVFVHNAIHRTNEAISVTGYPLPKAQPIDWQNRNTMAGKIVIVPPALIGSNMIKKIPNATTAFCSGWMHVRGKRRWKSVDAGFAVSDHADWDELLTAVKASEAEQIFVTHGYQAVFAKYLNELGYDAHELQTEYGSDETAGLEDSLEQGQIQEKPKGELLAESTATESSAEANP